MKFLINNRRLVVFTLLLMVVSLSAVIMRSNAQGKRLRKPRGHVNDFADVIDAVSKQRLETVLENLKYRTGVDFVLATVKSAGTEDLYDYSLRIAQEWNIGVPASPTKSVLLVITTDNAKFFTQVSKAAQAYLPEGLISNMGQRMHLQIATAGYSQGLISGIQTFVNGLGEGKNFNFEALDTQATENQTAQTRPRAVESPAPPTETPLAAPSETRTTQIVPSPTPTPLETPTPQPSVTPTPNETRTTQIVPSSTPTPLETPTPQPSITPTPDATPSVTPTPSPSETPTPSRTLPSPTLQPSEMPTVTASPAASAEPTGSPEVKTPEPAASPSAQPSATVAIELAENTAARPTRSPAPNRRATPGAVSANPDDEKEQVELTLTLPVEKRIDALKEFIVAHPKSVAVPRANELIVVAHATLGDQKLQAGDVEGGLQQFRLAISEAPGDFTDRLFNEVIARIPLNLFLRGQRGPAIETAHQAEALAKLNPRRLLALTQFYLAIEDDGEANRLAELATQLAPESAAAHQALGAARHIALRLGEAETEYARAVALDPKSTAAKVSLADLKRAGGKFEEALALYREALQADAKNKSARAGLVLSLLELSKKDEAEQELSNALNDKDQARNIPLLVGAAYWFLAHNDPRRGLELAQNAVEIEPRYSWSQIALARALVADRRPLEAERALRFARQFGQFPTLNYELATVLASVGLYDEAVQELARSFTVKDGQIEAKLAGRNAARAASFVELLAPERRAAIFQSTAADTEANAKMMRALLAFATAINRTEGPANEDELTAIVQDFIGGNDAMRTYRQVYIAGKFVRKGVGLSSVIDLMDQATAGVEAALSAPAATVAVQPEELADMRARALAQGGTPNVPDAPRAALSGLLRGRIEDLAGMAFFNLDKPNEAVARLRLAVSASPEGTPLKRTAMWHLGSALEASGKNDQALLYYIKSYLTGAPDPARRAVIESVYKKVNGTLDGLDDKIGPAFTTATATPAPTPEASPAASPTPYSQ